MLSALLVLWSKQYQSTEYRAFKSTVVGKGAIQCGNVITEEKVFKVKGQSTTDGLKVPSGIENMSSSRNSIHIVKCLGCYSK